MGESRCRLIRCVNVDKKKLIEVVRKNGYEPIRKTDDDGKEYLLCVKGDEKHIIYLKNSRQELEKYL